MKDERAMILNMLKEGKISVEEADALLGVLDETDETPAGFTAKNASEESKRDEKRDKSRDSGSSGPRAHAFVIDDDEGDHHDKGRRRGRGSASGPGPFTFDFDLSGIKESVRETMKGVSETVKDVMGELSGLDLGTEIFRAMGKFRSEVSDDVSEPADGAVTLKISNKWGDIRITGGDTDTVAVRANAVAWGVSSDDADEATSNLGLRLERSGKTLTVLNGLETRPLGRVRLDYEITLPKAMGVDVTTASGDVWIEGLDGAQDIKTLSGDVNVADLGADRAVSQSMKTKSGDVVGGALTGDITLSSASGDVEINGFTGNLQVTTQSGDIAIHDGAGSVQLKTISGDIDARLSSLGEKSLQLNSVSGDVALTVPPGAGLDITAKTTSGGIGVELDFVAERKTENFVTGTVNGGGLELSMTTVSGDIQLQH